MKKRKLRLTLAALLLALSYSAEAQQATKIPRIGYLGANSLNINPDRPEAFQQGLHELGYVEGKNIVIEWREAAKGNFDRARELADELVHLKADVLVSPGPSEPAF